MGKAKQTINHNQLTKQGSQTTSLLFLFVVSEMLFSPSNNKISVAVSVINLR